MGFFRKRTVVRPEELDELRKELASVQFRLDASEQSRGELERRLASVDAATQALSTAREHDQLRPQIEALRMQTTDLDNRLNGVSTELANQLSELSNDIEALTRRDLEFDVDTVATLTAAQVNLAKEQARYEIAFREDLAALAEQIRFGRAGARNGQN